MTDDGEDAVLFLPAAARVLPEMNRNMQNKRLDFLKGAEMVNTRFASNLFFRIVAAVSVLFLPFAAISADVNLELVLPPYVYAAEGLETGIYHDNIVLTETPEEYVFSINCLLGVRDVRGWLVIPPAGSAGEYPLKITVADKNGAVIAGGETVLRVAPRDSGSGETLRLLIVGDSLTAASVYSNRIAELLSSGGNPEWRMFGTSPVRNREENVHHEGYGGWTWERFLTRYQEEPGQRYNDRSSPFVFKGEEGSAGIDTARYVREVCGGQSPNLVTFLLGINDCFSADPDSIEEINRRVEGVLDKAEQLLGEFRKGMPDAALAVCLVPPPNAREEGFQASYAARYGDRYKRWGWKRIQHRLARAMMERFDGRESEGIFVIPTNLYIDPFDGYPLNNGVHPNSFGYGQIGNSVYAWMKWWLKGSNL